MAPPYKSSFSVRVVLPASGCEIIAKVRLLFISSFHMPFFTSTKKLIHMSFLNCIPHLKGAPNQEPPLVFPFNILTLTYSSSLPLLLPPLLKKSGITGCSDLRLVLTLLVTRGMFVVPIFWRSAVTFPAGSFPCGTKALLTASLLYVGAGFASAVLTGCTGRT